MPRQRRRTQFDFEDLASEDAKTKGQFETVKINDVSPDMSFLEMLDIVNEEQMKQGKEGEKGSSRMATPS